MPICTYFMFLRAALYAFVEMEPNTGMEGLPADAPFPSLFPTQLPVGLAGMVLTGLLTSAMLTLNSSIDATVAAVATDFYRRL